MNHGKEWGTHREWGERNQQSRISSSKHRGFSQCLKEFDQQIRKNIFKHGISLPRKGSSYIKRGFNNWLVFSQEHSRTPSSDWWGAPHIFGFIPSDIWMPSRQPSEIDMDKLRDRKHLGFSGWNVTCAHRKNDRLCWWKEPWVRPVTKAIDFITDHTINSEHHHVPVQRRRMVLLCCGGVCSEPLGAPTSTRNIGCQYLGAHVPNSVIRK